MEYVFSVLIGLVTGVFSSWSVSKIFQMKEDKRAYERHKRELYQFLLQLFDELVLIEKSGDCRALLEKLGRFPDDDWEGRYYEEDRSLVAEISDLIEELRIFGFSHTAGSGESLANSDELNDWQNRIPALAKSVLNMEYPKKKRDKQSKKH